jgi:2-C-methyl-D-erythritol 2,4-cyclodiphosphate synthase
VKVPFALGLEGHSDADVLLHAICDALLGAAGLGDIGLHFPDRDPAFQGISSLILLQRTAAMIHDRGYRIVNIDATVVAQAPKISPFRFEMMERIAASIGIEADRINIKATTSEGLDAAGEGKGIAATAVALID